MNNFCSTCFIKILTNEKLLMATPHPMYRLHAITNTWDSMKRRYEEEFVSGKDNVTSEKRAKYPVSVFSTKPRHKFDGKFPYFRKPKEIGKLSIDLKRIFHNDKSQLKFYNPPDNLKNVHFDLRNGYKDFIAKDESEKEYIDNILRWILNNPKQLGLKDTSIVHKSNLQTDFICWRGLITKLLCTPYENREGWKIAVTLFNGTYYLCEFETEQKKQQNEQRTEKQDEMAYWGWKFEQYITSDTVNGKPKTDTPVNNCEGYCTVVRSRLDQHSIVFSGEVDAVDPSINEETQYVEFKTTREIDNQRQDTNFKRFKLIKWWAQSFLVGISHIICGFRDDDGIVHRLKKFNVQDIPNIVKDIRDPWNPSVCFNFLDKFLSFIKKNIREDDASVVHLLEWEPHGDIHCQRLSRNSDYKFLPDWYTKGKQTVDNR